MYLDPGGIALVVSAIIGVVASIPVLVGIYWKKIKARLVKKASK